MKDLGLELFQKVDLKLLWGQKQNYAMKPFPEKENQSLEKYKK